jgi:hypothetical protein
MLLFVNVLRSPTTPLGNCELVLLMSHQMSLELASERETEAPDRSISWMETTR